MTEIGIESLAAGDREKDGAERRKPDQSMTGEESHPIDGIEGAQHVQILDDVPEARDGDGDEPDEGDRAEEGGDLGGASGLHREQGEKDQHGQRDDIQFESGSGHLEAFDRRQNRNRRGDQRVAVEQRGADDAEHDDGEALAPERARGKRHQSQRSTFAFVVGAEEDQHIFDGNNEDQRPNDQRKDAENDGLARSLTAARRQHQFAQRIERARSDVAVDDANATERKSPEIAARRSLGTRAVGGSV